MQAAEQLPFDEPPLTEPQRQYYFIDRLRELAAVRAKAAGRPLTFSIHTYGCQMNARDSEKLEGILCRAGFIPSEDKKGEKADFVIFNTCTVRENANMRLYGRLGQMKKAKQRHPGMIIAVCGCMMQEKEEAEKIRTSFKHVDIVFGTHNIFKLAELVCRKMEDEDRVFDIWEDTDQIVEKLPVRRKYPFKTGINIMFGCNNFCSYCIVPYVRGRERSREPDEIIQEIRQAVSEGVVEVMLLGQNVNSYGKTLDTPMSFAALLKEVEKIDGLRRIRFMTSHPKDLSGELIQVMAESEKICRHLHLPLQSGSTKVLKSMNRQYTKEQYLDLVRRIRLACPDISLTTDIIVGYPGESEEDFQETMQVVEEVGFDSAFTFIYSPRTGTPAASRTDQIPEEIVHERFNRLLELVQKKAAQKVSRFTGQVLPVLAEEVNPRDTGMLTGRLDSNIIVHFAGPASLTGKIVQVRLQECKGFYYIGELVSS